MDDCRIDTALRAATRSLQDKVSNGNLGTATFFTQPTTR
jgi:hypothetical protein